MSNKWLSPKFAVKVSKWVMDWLSGKRPQNNLYSMEEGALLAIIIFSSNEEVITATLSPPRSQDRMVKITVECYAKATVDANLVVDNLSMGDVALKEEEDCK